MSTYNMKKIVKRYGTSNVIVLDSEDMIAYNLKTGEIIDIDIIKEKSKKKNEK